MSINKLVLPDSVNTIKDYAFKNSTNLARVDIGGGGTNVLTSLDSIITALRNKGLTLANTAFNGISKIHTAHSFNYTTTTAATCTTSGTKTGTCTCGNTDTQTIAATGHSYGDWVVSSDESTKTRTCSKCGNKETVNNKVELKDADSATKSKYSFKCTGSGLKNISYSGTISGDRYGGTGGDSYNIFENITPSSCSVGSIVYIAADTNALYCTLNGNSTISAGYYKIKAICKRSTVLCYTSINYTEGACNLIPFAMGSGCSISSSSGNSGGNSSADQIKTELSKYIEYLGTSYKVIPA